MLWGSTDSFKGIVLKRQFVFTLLRLKKSGVEIFLERSACSALIWEQFLSLIRNLAINMKGSIITHKGMGHFINYKQEQTKSNFTIYFCHVPEDIEITGDIKDNQHSYSKLYLKVSCKGCRQVSQKYSKASKISDLGSTKTLPL